MRFTDRADHENPYRSPDAVRSSDAVEPHAGGKGVEVEASTYYPIGVRYGAAQIDLIAVFVIGVVAAKQLEEFGNAPQVAVFVALFFAYYILSEGFFHATPGKLIFGLRVARRDGGRCSWRLADAPV